MAATAASEAVQGPRARDRRSSLRTTFWGGSLNFGEIKILQGIRGKEIGSFKETWKFSTQTIWLAAPLIKPKKSQNYCTIVHKLNIKYRKKCFTQILLDQVHPTHPLWIRRISKERYRRLCLFLTAHGFTFLGFSKRLNPRYVHIEQEGLTFGYIYLVGHQTIPVFLSSKA